MDMSKLEEVYKKWESRCLFGKGNSLKAQQRLPLNGNSAEGAALRSERGFHNGKGTTQALDRRKKLKIKSWKATIGIELLPDLASFKSTAPAYTDVRAPLRPFTGRCCSKCTPMSRGMYYDNDTPAMGIRNILHVQPGRGFFSRRFPILAHELGLEHTHDYPNPKKVLESVVNSDRVQAAIEKSAMSDIDGEPEKFPFAVKKHAARAYHLVTNMIASISNKLIGFTGWFLLRVMSSFFTGVHVHTGQMQTVKRASEKGVPMIFLPMHRSHLDYILVTFVLHQWNIKAPHIAAGDNLNITFFNWLIRHLGGFFIKRKLDRDDGKKDYVYRAVLHDYMLEVLRQNQNLEFFLEGGRSRSGKSLPPKGGLLSVVVDACMNGIISDAYVVPVSISYEKVWEGNYNREQMGHKKDSESFLNALWGLWQVARQHSYGSVRLDFAQPFSLQEYLQGAQPSIPVSSELTDNGSPRSPKMKSVGSDNSLYGTEIINDDLRLVIKGLGEHIMCEATRCQSIMSTNLLAFLLLTKHRQGATVAKLTADLEWLRQEITARGRDIGFSGKSEAVINYAANLLGNKLVEKRKRKRLMNKVERDAASAEVDVPHCQGNDILVPNTSLPDVLELSYYANAVTSVFLMEAVVATAIGAACDENLTVKQGHDECITVSRDKVVDRALELCDLLQCEFTFIPPCENLSTAVLDGLERLTTAEIIMPEETKHYTTSQEKSWADRLANNTSWEEDEDVPMQPDQQLKINLSSEHLEKLTFFQSILAPLVESYWFCACNLTRLIKKDIHETEFTQVLGSYAKERVYRGLTNYAESCALETLKNTLRLLNQKKITDTYFDAKNKKLIQLREAYRDEEKLNSLIEKLEEFKM
ncbi:glycerol-3-phosphate acyltransferase 1, mitochondrial-like isoform X2 [Ptychodera flava]